VVLASLRAELLTLRKWWVAWALVLLTPVVLLLGQVTTYVYFLTARPEQYGSLGSPQDVIPGCCPSSS